MKLSEFLAQGPDAVAEIEKVKADARDALKAITATVTTRCVAILESKAYSDPIKSLACKVIKGESDVSALDAATAIADQDAERLKSDAARLEQAGQAATAPQSPDAKAQEAAEINAMAGLIAGKREGK
jgi:hypothetical protein